jgi:hypothetical protein
MFDATPKCGSDMAARPKAPGFGMAARPNLLGFDMIVKSMHLDLPDLSNMGLACCMSDPTKLEPDMVVRPKHVGCGMIVVIIICCY